MALIKVVSVGNVNQELMQMIMRHVGEMFGCDVEPQNRPSLVPPDNAYDEKKKQYSSTVILRSLARLNDSSPAKLLAITEVDLFIPMLTFVYGQAQLSGKVAVVSLARLKPEFYGLPPDKDLTVRRIRKEVSHELGHAFGLIHCPDKSCLMSLSTEIMQVDLKSENFCRSCWIVLEENLGNIKKQAAAGR
jgi:archaemetzincin